MSKTPEKVAEAQSKEAAVITPVDEAAAEAEATRLWKEMASKHSDPHGSGVGARPEFADDAGDDDKQEPEAKEAANPEGKAKEEAQTELKPEPAKAAAEETPKPEKQPAAKASASKDAPAADDIWAKADTDPRTKALKDAYDAAPESARPAIEAAQRRLNEQGKEIRLHRNERQEHRRTAVVAPAKKEVEETYDLAKDPDLAQIKTDYPDVGGAIEKILGKALGSTKREFEARVAPIAATTKAHDTAFEEQGLRSHNQLLHELHPNYSKVVTSEGFRPAFDDWIEQQPEEIRAMVDANRDYVRDARKASTVFKLFQSDTGYGIEAAKEPESKAEPAQKPEAQESKPQPDPAKQAKRRSQLQGSDTVEGRGQAAVTGDPNDEEYWRNYWLTKKREQQGAESRLN